MSHCAANASVQDNKKGSENGPLRGALLKVPYEKKD